jgi:DNA-binding transcriptional regulator YhcF (GntR family)
MPINLQVDPSSEIPAYRQIIEQIASLVRAGELKAGDRLPPARELASQLGIARGTIAKAYEELARCAMLDATPGRGSFVSARQDVVPTSRRERAVQLIHAMIDELEAFRFSAREIRNMVDLILLEREEQFENLHIAAVDCSPEALTLFGHQLGLLSRIDIKTILLDDLAAGPDPDRRLAEFDLVMTTAKHFSEVLGLAQSVRDKLVQVIVSPSQETIVNLAGLKPPQSLGIICQSAKFLAIIQRMLDDLGITNPVASLTGTPGDEPLRAFVADKDVLIVPPGFAKLLSRPLAPVIAEFTERGGRLLPFDYQIERGSLIYLEERIRSLKDR